MTQEDRERLRATFDQAAELSDRARPGYPPALFDDLAGLAGIGPGSRVLEIGPGTGQATGPPGRAWLPGRGRRARGGPGRRRRAQPRPLPGRRGGHGRVRGLATAGRAVRPGPGRDLVPLARPRRPGRQGRRRLRPGGTLATVATHHVAGGDESFFAEAQACYIRWDPATPPDGAPLRAGLLDCIVNLIDSGYGGRVTKRYLTELRVASTPEG